MNTASHRLTNLAERPGCRVQRCSCGVYHIAIGAVTVRLPTEAAKTLLAVLGEAIGEEPSARPLAH